MTSVLSNNKRIAKNTMMLYVRMLLSMIVSLYTSRVVLDVLGVEDFGIYGVVGGVVAMFSFLNSSMGGATARFLTFEIGGGSFQRLKETFSSALILHIGIALLVFVLAETVGLWFVYNKLVIPEERMVATIWVYQFSVLTTIVNITQIPYNASIIAHEKMGVYAYVEIVNVILRLLTVYLLVVGHFDKLKLYAILTFSVSLIIAFTYRTYCLKRFEECRFGFAWNKGILKPMLSFSGWNLYGSLSVVVRTQGIGILLNLFFGVVLNAAIGIANQIQGVILSFVENFLIAVQPQIVKSYASHNRKRMESIVYNSSLFSFLLLSLISLPLIIEMDYILKLWLKKTPPFCVPFCQLILINNLLSILFRPIIYSIHATGKIKKTNFINGSIYLCVIPISYILFQYNFQPVTPYIVNIILLSIGCALNLHILHLLIPEFSIKKFIFRVGGICLSIITLSLALSLYVHYSLEASCIRVFYVILSSTLSIVVLSYFIALDKTMKKRIRLTIFNQLKK